MLSLLTWIPILGPIVQGLFSFLNKVQDKEIVQIQTDGTTSVEAIKASAQVIHDTQDDIGVRLSRDLIMFPGSAWCALYMWDKIVDHHYPDLVWNVAALDGPLAILPSALLVFFFGYAAVRTWRNK